MSSGQTKAAPSFVFLCIHPRLKVSTESRAEQVWLGDDLHPCRVSAAPTGGWAGCCVEISKSVHHLTRDRIFEVVLNPGVDVGELLWHSAEQRKVSHQTLPSEKTECVWGPGRHQLKWWTLTGLSIWQVWQRHQDKSFSKHSRQTN